MVAVLDVNDSKVINGWPRRTGERSLCGALRLGALERGVALRVAN
jgi:hypothetical protein